MTADRNPESDGEPTDTRRSAGCAASTLLCRIIGEAVLNGAHSGSDIVRLGRCVKYLTIQLGMLRNETMDALPIEDRINHQCLSERFDGVQEQALGILGHNAGLSDGDGSATPIPGKS